MHVLAFRHAALEDIGSIGDALARHQIGCRYYDLYRQPGTIPDLIGAAGIILMGGAMSVNDDLPWIATEIECIREAIRHRIPVLGICLGAQLIAQALGARVYRNPVQEIGWAPVQWTDDARADRLFRSFAQPETIFHWHGETFDLPAGAHWLACSDACRHQAFRVGDNVYGLQFHIEVTPEMISSWLPETEVPIDPHAHAARLAELAATVFDSWCELLGDSNPSPSLWVPVA